MLLLQEILSAFAILHACHLQVRASTNGAMEVVMAENAAVMQSARWQIASSPPFQLAPSSQQGSTCLSA